MVLGFEEAHRQLQEQRVPDAVDRALRRIGRLRPDAREAAIALHPEVGHRDGQRSSRPDQVGTWIDRARPRTRRRLFAALHPTLGGLLDAWWSAAVADPYTRGWARRPFRSPTDPAASYAARCEQLAELLHVLGPFERDPAWVATWLSHLGGWSCATGRLLSVAMAEGHAEVRTTLHAVAAGDHPIGTIDRQLVAALLTSDDPDDHHVVVQLLLAAGRQEGLRSAVLEAVDVAAPAAFVRVVDVVRERELTRFASTVRAAGVWFGASFDVRDRRRVDDLIDHAAAFLRDPVARRTAADADDPVQVQLALWATAYDDVEQAIPLALRRLDAGPADVRVAAAHVLADAQRPRATLALVSRLGDDDLRIAALGHLAVARDGDDLTDPTVDAGLRALLDRLPRATPTDLGVLRREPVTVQPTAVADLLVSRASGEASDDLVDVLERCSASGRHVLARRLAEDPVTNRAWLLTLTGDRADHVRAVAFEALGRGSPPTTSEAEQLESLLRRRTAGVRRGVLQLLLRQDDPAVLGSVERLLDGHADQRSGAVELLRELRIADRSLDEVDRRFAALADDERLRPADHDLLRPLDRRAGDGGRRPGPATVDPFAELVEGQRPTVAVAPPDPGDLGDLLAPHRAGAALVLRSLDAWITEHAEVEVTVSEYGGPRTTLLSDLRFVGAPDPAVPWQLQRHHVPLQDLLDAWWEHTAGSSSEDGLEVVTALLELEALPYDRDTATATIAPALGWFPPGHTWPRWHRRLTGLLRGDEPVPPTHASLVAGLLGWQVVRLATATWVDLLLQVAEATVCAVPVAVRSQTPVVRDGSIDDWREGAVLLPVAVLGSLVRLRPELVTAAQRGRVWRLCRYLDQPWAVHASSSIRPHLPRRTTGRAGDGAARPGPPRRYPPIDLAVTAVEDGHATEADVLDLLLADRGLGAGHVLPVGLRRHHGERPLYDLTGHGPRWLREEHPWLADLVDRLRATLVAAELTRGELPVPTTRSAMELRSVVGADTSLRLLASLGRNSLVRGYAARGDGARPAVVSHLVRVSFPVPDDTPDAVAELATELGLDRRRLLDLAVYAPQWADLLEQVVAWPGLADAVHWIHAHTKDDRWYVDPEVRERWEAAVAERTRLTADELRRGHVDVPWFRRAVASLGETRFLEVLAAAKLAAAAGGHTRATLFAKALLGRLDRHALEARIADKRHQDSVRALGLLALPDAADRAEAEVLARYRRLLAWRRAGNGGRQKRASEAAAVEVALANLARTAGYPDPQRLMWAMEAASVRDLAAGPVTVTSGDLEVRLSIDELGAPVVAVRRGERVLKRIPNAAAKDPDIAAVRARVADLKEQTQRMRRALEAAMVRGDAFTGRELHKLCDHPSLAPMVRALVLVTTASDGTDPRPGHDGDPDQPVLGLLDEEATHLVDVDGHRHALDQASVRVAHPVDLLVSGRWSDWQRLAFAREVRQPCKQLFRELYVPTVQERDGATRTDRYAGHQLVRSTATGILRSRGWAMDPVEGGATRTDHDLGLTARVEVLDGWLTAVEAADTMLQDVWFHRAGTAEVVPLERVPPRWFSEVLRDLDLVVSIAHSGGVDPESTASTVEMRAALVRETCEALGLDGVELTDHHAVVRGSLGTYSVNLGSAVVHRRPGNALCIVPVGSQHRGRLFLPFVDDDPRTAEVVSKVVLLARDDRIRDPSILEQLRAAAV
jgi:hypothetical protein